MDIERCLPPVSALADDRILEEATIFGDDVATATLELGLATDNMARGSVARGPLADWWKDGMKKVRVVD